MRILNIFCTKYVNKDGTDWLISYMVKKICLEYNIVNVYLINWEGYNNSDIKKNLHSPNINIYIVNFPSLISRFSLFYNLFKWLVMPLLFVIFYFKINFKKTFKYRNIKKNTKNIFFSPLYIFSPFLLFKFNKDNNYVFYWDFFPGHNFFAANVNKISIKLFENFLLMIERFCLKRMKFIYFPEIYYINFFRKYYRTNNDHKLKIFPLWNVLNNTLTIKNTDLKKNKNSINVCFLGQMTGGRLLLEILPLLISVGDKFDVVFNFIGGGKLLDELRTLTKDEISIYFHGYMPTNKYDKIINNADFGLVPVGIKHGFPSYPSKILDFFSRGIPVILITDKYSDLNKIIESHNLGFSIVIGRDEPYVFLNKLNLCIEHYSHYSECVRNFNYEHHSFDSSKLFK